jgi:uncharacterized RDD family membrane protein YckC
MTAIGLRHTAPMAGHESLVEHARSPDRLTFSRRPRQPGFVYAEASRRAAAFAVDLSLAALVVAIVSRVAASPLSGQGFRWGMDEPWLLGLLLLVSLLSALPTAYYAHLWRTGRQTPGHRMFNIEVVRRTVGGPPSALASLARWILLYAPLGLWAFPGVLWVAFDPGPFLMLIEFSPWVSVVGMGVPVAWYVLLGSSVLLDRRRGRGLHDRIGGTVVVRPIR